MSTPPSPPVVSTPTTSPTPVVTSTPRIHSESIPTRPMSSGYRHDGHNDYHYRRPYYHRPIYYGGYYPSSDWWYNRPSTVYVTEETKKEDFNYLPIYVIGGISVISLLVALQKK
jgi:hypothetical protein